MQLHAGKTTRVQSDETFNEAVRPYLNELKKYCYSLTKSQWNGEDLAQEALTKAYISWWKKAKPISKAFLMRIASNLWIDAYRKRKPEIDFQEDLAHHGAKESPVVTEELQEAMEILLSRLTLKQRVSVLLMEGLQFTAKETAEMLGMTEGAVKASLHRARKKLSEANGRTEYECDEEEVKVYVKAFCSGISASVVELYKNPANEPQMFMNKREHNSRNVRVKEISGSSHSTYVLVPITMNNGVRLYIPIYQTELNVLLSWIEELTGQSQLDFAA